MGRGEVSTGDDTGISVEIATSITSEAGVAASVIEISGASSVAV